MSAPVVSPLGVLSLDQITAAEYGGIKVAELGDGVVEGYHVVAFTDDPQKALAAVRAHMLMVHNDIPDLAFFWWETEQPVRWWQVYGTCGCGDTCPHGEDEDHGCARQGLPPCRRDGEDETSWVGELCDQTAPGAAPVVEIEVGSTLTADERVTEMGLLLGEARKKLRALVQACVDVKPVLDVPGSVSWQQVERPAKDAQAVALEISQALRWQAAGARQGGVS